MQSASVYPLLIDHNTRHRFGGALLIRGRKFHIYMLYVSIRRDVPEVGTADMAEWHILIEMKKDVIVASESDVIIYLDGVNPKTQPATVRENGNYSNITLTIPHDWEYETERKNDSTE